MVDARIEGVRRLVLGRLRFLLYCWTRMPLAGFAGIRVVRLDSGGATVLLPGGFRSRNPFGSVYFAAQAMAAELSTGALLLAFVSSAGAPMSMLVVDLHASFVKKLTGAGRFSCEDGAKIQAAVDRVAQGADPEVVEARSEGRDGSGELVSSWTISWRIKRRGPPRTS